MRNKEAKVAVTRYSKEGMKGADDMVATEEPLEIHIDGSPHYLTMRLPGEETYLALGYCFSEGIIDSMKDIHIVHYCGDLSGNRVEVVLDQKRKAARKTRIKKRSLPAYSSCGICGKETVKDICLRLKRRKTSFNVTASSIEEMMREAERHQPVFAETGGAHAVAIFDKDCRLLAVSEDVGRHNALDKVMGKLVSEGRIKEAMVVIATSRLSYEMVQKAGRSNAEVLAGISSATSLAVDLAKRVNMTLIGFARNGRGNVYTAAERIFS